METLRPGARLNSTSAILFAIVLVFAPVAPLGQETPADAAVSGVVTDAITGDPLSAVQVSLRVGPIATRRVLTDEKGRFVFVNLTPGHYSLAGAKPGYFSTRPWEGISVVIAAREWIPSVSLKLGRPGELSGRVLNERGDTLAGVTVYTMRRVPVAGRMRFVAGPAARADERGRYRIGGLSAGAYVVAALGRTSAGIEREADRAYTFFPDSDGLEAASIMTVVEGRQVTDVDVMVRSVPTRVLSGIVVNGAGGGHTVRLLAAACGGTGAVCEIYSTVTDALSQFSFPAVAVGRYMLHVGDLSGLTYLPPPDALPSAAQMPSFLGLADAGSAVQMAMRFLPNSDLMSVKRTGGSRPQGFGRTPVVVADRDVTGIVLDTAPLADIAGSVRWDTGEPATPLAARVLADPADGLGPVLDAQTDAEGRFVIRDVPPGRFFVRVNGQHVRSVRVGGEVHQPDAALEVAASAGTVAVELTVQRRKSTVSGFVRSRSSLPALRIVSAFPVSRSLWIDSGLYPEKVKTATVSVDGSYAVDLPPDEYYLAVTSGRECSTADCLASLVATAARVTVSSGVNARLDLSFNP